MRKLWTKEEEEWMKENYEKVGLYNAMEILGRNRSSILHKAHKMNLKRQGKGRLPRFYVYDGYLTISNDKWRKQVHRAVMEKKLGRPLTTDEIVHHIDGDRFNNKLENLELHTRSSHMSIHYTSRERNEKGQFV